MPKSLFSLAFLLVFCWQAGAQKAHHFNLKLNSTEKKTLPFTLNEVIDTRLDKHSCGNIPGTAEGQRMPIDFAGSLEKEIQALLPELFTFNSAKHQICLVVRELWIASSGHSLDPGQLSVLYDFYLKKGTKYLQIGRSDSHWEIAGLNVVKSHSQNILKSIQAASVELSESDWAVAIDNPKGKWQSREEIKRESQAFTIRQNRPLKAGIYLSFMEFRANAPSITEVDIVLKKNAGDILQKRDVQFKGLAGTYKTKAFPKRIWGFCDGNKVYINNWLVFQDFSFSPLISIGDYCPFVGKENLRHISRSSMATRVSSNGQKEAYAFDAIKGQAFLLDEGLLLKILGGRGDLIHKYKQERDKENPLTKSWYVSAATK